MSSTSPKGRIDLFTYLFSWFCPMESERSIRHGLGLGNSAHYLKLSLKASSPVCEAAAEENVKVAGHDEGDFARKNVEVKDVFNMLRSFGVER